MKLAWLTDIHVDFVGQERMEELMASVEATGAGAVVLTGDISNGPMVHEVLKLFGHRLRRPVYFVLGNHDFYRSSVAAVRWQAEQLTADPAQPAKYLPAAGPVSLSAEWALVGVDGWADGRFGAAQTTDVLLNDFFHIQELRGLPLERGRRDQLLARLRELAAHSAALAARLAGKALETHRAVVVATHVPPFREACWHQGSISGDDWLPWFTCKAVGDALRACMEARPDKEMLVLCGHTHGEGEAQILPNLRVLTGGAVYTEPRVQRCFDL